MRVRSEKDKYSIEAMIENNVFKIQTQLYVCFEERDKLKNSHDSQSATQLLPKPNCDELVMRIDKKITNNIKKISQRSNETW